MKRRCDKVFWGSCPSSLRSLQSPNWCSKTQQSLSYVCFLANKHDLWTHLDSLSFCWGDVKRASLCFFSIFLGRLFWAPLMETVGLLKTTNQVQGASGCPPKKLSRKHGFVYLLVLSTECGNEPRGSFEGNHKGWFSFPLDSHMSVFCGLSSTPHF